jgi:hypothetical protein
MGLSQSLHADVQPAIDPNSPADFYGLFNGGNKFFNEAEEQKVLVSDA